MANDERNLKDESPQHGGKWVWCLAGLVLVVFIALAILLWGVPPLPKAPIQLSLGDGRILQIEGVTYGTKHRIGQASFLFEHFRPWLPAKLRSILAPKRPESTIELERPALVVWVNAIDPLTGANVDCQGISTEFLDKNGDLNLQATADWFGGQKFWRTGHVFYAYPKDEPELTFQVTSWRASKTFTVTFPNPHLIQPARWSGLPLPQSKSVGEIEILLTGFNIRTNRDKTKTLGINREPNWEIRQKGLAAKGWEKPEWISEDPLGNRGEYLAFHQPVLRYTAIFYPEATNTQAALLMARLPKTDLSRLNTNLWWDQEYQFGSNHLVALGICPPGTHVFSEGKFDPNGPPMGPVHGGAPSGWTGQSQRVSPIQVKEWNGHYTPSTTIYIRASDLKESDRLGLRVRDEQGRYWLGKPEPQGSPRQGIRAFLLELPTEVTNVVPELVLLKPLQADFLVKMR